MAKWNARVGTEFMMWPFCKANTKAEGVVAIELQAVCRANVAEQAVDGNADETLLGAREAEANHLVFVAVHVGVDHNGGVHAAHGGFEIFQLG